MASLSEKVQRLVDVVVAASGRSLPAGVIGDRDVIVGALAPIVEGGAFSVGWAAVNGSRVDAGVTAGEREWRVVLTVDSAGVDSAVVLERPAFFAGVPGGTAVIVNGPSSVGKSTVMEAVVQAAPTPWIMFDELSFGTVGLPFLIWGESCPTLTPGFVAGITALAAAGNQVILSGSDAALFEGLHDAVPTLCVGLHCPLAVLLERQAARTDRWGGLTEATQDNAVGWTFDLRFDTSMTTPPEIAAAILQAVSR